MPGSGAFTLTPQIDPRADLTPVTVGLGESDNPEAVRFKAALRDDYLRYSGPGGMTEQDDMENWSKATPASTGALARRRAYSYQLGLGKERPVPGLAGAIQSASYSDASAWRSLEPAFTGRSSRPRAPPT